MHFTPKTEADLTAEQEASKAKFLPWPAGTICDYEIIGALDKISKKGNEMIELRVTVFNGAGEEKTLNDYVGEWNIFKLKRICDANDMVAQYNAGSVGADDLQGKTGKCRIGIRKGTQKDDGTWYSDQNDIAEYLKPEPKAKPLKEVIGEDDPFGDFVPF